MCDLKMLRKDAHPMPKIVVELPEDRKQAGSLIVENDEGHVIAGPFVVLGRADRDTANGNGNPFGDPMMKYGDTPLVNYSVSGFRTTPFGPKSLSSGDRQ